MLAADLKEASETIKQKEKSLQARTAQLESTQQRLQVAHADIESHNKNYPQLEVKYIEEKQKNYRYADLQLEYLKLKNKMERDGKDFVPTQVHVDYKEFAEATIKKQADQVEAQKQQISKLKQEIADNNAYIATTETNYFTEQSKQAEKDAKIVKLEHEIRELKIDRAHHGREMQKARAMGNVIQDENDRMKHRLNNVDSDTRRLEEQHAAEVRRLKEKIDFERTQLNNFRSDAREVQKQAEEAQARLEEKEVETKELIKRLEAATEGFTEPTGGGSPQTSVDEAEIETYRVLIRSILKEVELLNTRQAPSFLPDAKAFRSDLEDSGRLPDSSSSSSTTDTSSESDSIPGEGGEEEEAAGPAQVIHRRGKGGFGGKPIIKIKEVIREVPVQVPGPIQYVDRFTKVPTKTEYVETERIIEGPNRYVEREVPVPGPIQYVEREVPVPGPIEYVDREVPVPGPTVYVNVPGAEIEVPGPTRYTPFQVSAHNPIICWLLVEFNFLVLFFHWLRRLLAVLSWIPATIFGGHPWAPPDYASSSSSSSDADSDAGVAPHRIVDRQPLFPVLSVLFYPKRGRVPSVWDTFWGVVFHLIVYATICMFFSVWQERDLWLAENDATRRWLHTLVSQRGSNGFLGMNQILPQIVTRRLEILRFDFLELVGLPVAYRFPG